MENIFFEDTVNTSTLNKLNKEYGMIDKFVQKGYGLNKSIKMALIIAGSKTLIDAQDRLLMEFHGDFNIIYRCIDILEEYYI